MLRSKVKLRSVPSPIPPGFSFLPLQEVNSVYRILSAILNTGNIEFASITSQHQTDKSEVPNSEALENGTKSYTSNFTPCSLYFIGPLCPRNETNPPFTSLACSVLLLNCLKLQSIPW